MDVGDSSKNAESSTPVRYSLVRNRESTLGRCDEYLSQLR